MSTKPLAAVRRHRDGIIAVHSPDPSGQDWLIVYRPDWINPDIAVAIYERFRLTDREVATWQFLTATQWSQEEIERQAAGFKQAERVWHKEYGRLSAEVGRLRAARRADRAKPVPPAAIVAELRSIAGDPWTTHEVAQALLAHANELEKKP